MERSLVLPTVKPEADQLEYRQGIIQSETHTVHQFGQVAEIEVRVNVRILKVLHHDKSNHVKEPAKRPVGGAGPYADQTETDLQQRAYGTSQHDSV